MDDKQSMDHLIKHAKSVQEEPISPSKYILTFIFGIIQEELISYLKKMPPNSYFYSLKQNWKGHFLFT